MQKITHLTDIEERKNIRVNVWSNNDGVKTYLKSSPDLHSSDLTSISLYVNLNSKLELNKLRIKKINVLKLSYFCWCFLIIYYILEN